MTDQEALIFVHQEFFPATNHGAEAKKYVMRILKERMGHDKETANSSINEQGAAVTDDHQQWYERGVSDTWEKVTAILNDSREEDIVFVKKDEPNRIARRAINLHPNDIFYFSPTADKKAKRITSIRYGFDTRFPLTITYIHLDTLGEGYITADADDWFYVRKEK